MANSEIFDFSNNSGICLVCKKTGKFTCSGCTKVFYCSREHQKKDWKIHKPNCRLWKLCWNEELGRHLVATRDIKVNETIMMERPLLVTPPRSSPPVCLACYTELLPSDPSDDSGMNFLPPPSSCPKGCGWPLCGSEQCSQASEHEAECREALNRGTVTVKNFGIDHPLYQSVGILRALRLAQEVPQQYEKLMNLQSHFDEAKENGGTDLPLDLFQNDAHLLHLMRHFFKVEVPESLIHKIAGILETNGHEIPLSSATCPVPKRVIGVYENASYFEHNCIPNCAKTFDIGTKEIIIRAAVGIKKGENLSLCYLDPLWGTHQRLGFLQLSKHFVCKCRRCRDPTELDSHISSLKCLNPDCSKLGMVVTTDPFVENSDWKCLSCCRIYPPSWAYEAVLKTNEQFAKLSDAPVEDKIKSSEEFIEEASLVLSPNHYFLLEVKVGLAQMYGRLVSEPLALLPLDKLRRKMNLCHSLMDVLNKIIPGRQRIRGIILYELQAAAIQLHQHELKMGLINKSEFRTLLKESLGWLKESISILQLEPEGSLEKERATGGKKELSQLTNVFQKL